MAERSSIFFNAVKSLQLGIQDFSSDQEKRLLSAVRNFYSGLLLLGKENLIFSSPKADPTLLLASNYRPLPDGKGGVRLEPSKATIDFDQLLKRLGQFGKPIDKEKQAALKALRDARNEIEHGSIEHGHQKLRELISSLFPLTIEWFKDVGEDPLHHLESAYDTMLEVHEVFEAELARCRSSYKNVNFHSESITDEALICPACGSTLVEQLNTENTEQCEMKLRCRTCGTKPERENVIVETLDTILGYEAYTRMTDSGEDGPIYFCPSCGQNAFVDFEEACAACGYQIEAMNCQICGSGIETEIRLEGSTLCSNCRHTMEKD
ncbi:hypothetical protein [Thalassospira marina]|uniref:Uncharacterized protein n=1 Tax=Thalassospira marina TaxID=2048283 RepID=A0A2N3KIY8_9PROT|nr:hypothetical protein [Thalassospira marina]PKR50466.1 hypothetical protein COO20_21580 [Thalassospira marina]